MQKRTHISLLLSVASAALFAAPASAQQSAAGQPEQVGDKRQLEEIIVTARKRAHAEVLQDVPLSATAFGPAQLQSAVARDLVDVGRLAPGASLQPGTQRGVQNFSIRGMGVPGSVPSDEPAVAILQDGIYWGSNYGALGSLFDVEGVDILRGPQGTLFGRNVTGGAILVRSARPTAAPLVKGTMGIGSFGLKEFSGVVNGPIAGDVLTARVGAQMQTFDGYFQNTNTHDNYGKSTSYIIRPSVKFAPSSDFDLTLIGEWYSEKGDPMPARGIAPSTTRPPVITLPEREGYVMPSDFWTVSSGDLGYTSIDVYFTAIEANWKIGNGTLTSITGYRNVRHRVRSDFDGSPSNGFVQQIEQNQDQKSSELRYAGDIGDSLTYTVGGYYFKQNFHYREGRDTNNHTSVVGTASYLANESYAAFAEIDYKLTDRLTLTGGARYTEETKDARSSPFGTCNFVGTVCTAFKAGSTKGKNFSPKAGLSFKFADKQLLFVSFTRGYRSGGFALRGTVLASPYRPEKVSAFEVGYKGDITPRFRVNTSAYYNKFSDLQRTVLGVDPVLGNIQNVFNAAKATIYGAEIEATYLVGDYLTVSGNYGLTHARYDEFLGVANPKARRFTRIPAGVGSASLEYKYPLENGGVVTARTAGYYSASQFFDDINTLKQKHYALLDASVAYTLPSGHITISVWGKNLTETKYVTFASSLGVLGQNDFPGAPRTWGLRIAATY